MRSIQKHDTAGHSADPVEVSVQIRKAVMADVGPLLRLINGYASLGMMLPRTEFELSESIRDFTVAHTDTGLIGCGALHFYGPTTAEVRSLAVDPQWKRHGIGRRLMFALEAEAEAHGLESIFAFTYVPGYFERFGFVEVEREELPSKVWKDCLRCPKFQCCDEIAMRKALRAQMRGLEATPICGDFEGTITDENGQVILPTTKTDPP